MACLNATAQTAAASRIPVPVQKRTLLKEGMVVSIKVPQEARSGHVEDEGRTIHFLQFKFNVVGGMINFFVHGTTAEELHQYYGDTISAAATIWQKDMEDGRKFVYVDLLPAEGSVSHEIFVLGNMGPKAKGSIPYAEASWIVFETPLPLQGAVVIVPIGTMKLSMPAPAQQGERVAQAAPATSTTGYPGLDRKLNEGWLVEGADSDVVNLYKIKDGKKKTDTFFKPKLKTKKKR